MSAHQIDDLDRAIIRELESDGRRAMREIARNLDTSEATVRLRVKRLRESNMLRIIAFADPREMGDMQLALVSLKVDAARHADIVEALVALPETSYVSSLLGEADISCEVQSHSNQHLWEVLNTRIARLPGVLSTSTQPIVSVHKLGYQHRVSGQAG